MRMLLLLVWFAFIASASLWLPAYEGDLGGEEAMFVPVYALVAGLAAIGVRGRTQSVPEALLAALPVLVLLGGAAVSGYFLNELRAEYRGSPIFLYFGVALCASWAALVLSAALILRTKWNGFAGIGVGLFVALFGLVLFTARID